MFNRAILKKNAKTALKQGFGMAILVTLIISAATGLLSGTTINYSAIPQITASLTGQQSIGSGSGALVIPGDEELGDINADPSEFMYSDSQQSNTVANPGIINTRSSSFGFLIQYLVLNILSVGLCYFFLRLRQGDKELGNILRGFNTGYGRNVLTLFLRDIYLTLWTLLLIIPGIIKAYEYSMIPYLLADDPSLSRKDAFRMSKQLTKGHKWDLFVLDLSFIGWALLCLLTCGIGFFFLNPYIQATKAEAYEFLKQTTLPQITVMAPEAE